MKESEFANELRAHRIFNNYDMLKRFGTRGDVAIEYRAPVSGRAGWGGVHRTTVWSVYKHPALTPNLLRGVAEVKFIGNRKATLGTAISWANNTFGHVYESSPFGGYLPARVLKKAKQLAKEKANGHTC